MQKFVDLLILINTKLGEWVSWLTIAMVAVMFLNVILRYLLQTTLVWQQELVSFMHSIVFLSVAGYGLIQQKHVSVDILYQRCTERTQALIQLLGTCVFLLPMCIAIAYFSTDFIASSWELKEASPEYNGIYGIFILKSFIWVFCTSLILQGVVTIITSLQTLSSR